MLKSLLLLVLFLVGGLSSHAADDAHFRKGALRKSKTKEIYDAWALNPVNGLTRTGAYFLQTQGRLLRLTSAFAPFAGPVGVAWVFVNELADARPAYGSLGDPYRSAEGLFRFARLTTEKQAEILRIDTAFARWYQEQQGALEHSLPALNAIRCGGEAISALGGDQVKLEIFRDEQGVFDRVRALDQPSGLRAEFHFADGMLEHVLASAGEKDLAPKELSLSQYEHFLAKGNWVHGREAHRRMRAALVGALFRADLVGKQCPVAAAVSDED